MGIFGKLFGNDKQQEEKNTISHQEEWDSYMTHVDNVLGSIMVDLGIKSIAPVQDKPNVAWISVNMNNPREDGLSSNEESNGLYQIEDALVDTLALKYNCIYVGRLTSDGHRDFYFYFGKNDGCDKTISEVMKAFPGYEYDFGIKEDKDWSGYLDFLYPLPIQYQEMMNRRVLINLEKNGDNHEIPREVDHFLYFNTEEGRTGFIEFAEGKGFSVKQTNTKESENYKFMLHLIRIHKVDFNSINEYTIELWEAAPGYSGYYDGWGCPIAK